MHDLDVVLLKDLVAANSEGYAVVVTLQGAAKIFDDEFTVDPAALGIQKVPHNLCPAGGFTVWGRRQ
jgi:hypothetical protein